DYMQICEMFLSKSEKEKDIPEKKVPESRKINKIVNKTQILHKGNCSYEFLKCKEDIRQYLRYIYPRDADDAISHILNMFGKMDFRSETKEISRFMQTSSIDYLLNDKTNGYASQCLIELLEVTETTMLNKL